MHNHGPLNKQRGERLRRGQPAAPELQRAQLGVSPAFQIDPEWYATSEVTSVMCSRKCLLLNWNVVLFTCSLPEDEDFVSAPLSTAVWTSPQLTKGTGHCA